MPTQDELLLNFVQQGAEDVARGADSVADNLDKVSTSQDKVNDASTKSTKSLKENIKGMADFKAGLDLVKDVGGKVVDFLKDAVEGTVEYAAEVRDLSRAIGASAEEASAMVQVADDVGVSVGTLEAAFKAAIKNGIQPSIDNLSKLSDEYNSIQDPVQRSQFAMDKFGRAGLDMAKLLEQGGDAIRDAAEEAKELGLTLDDAAVKEARQFEIQLDNMGDKVEALKLKIGKGLIPVLNTLFDTADKGFGTIDLLTNGAAELGVTFSATAMKMQTDLASGKMTLDQYNAGIHGMAAAVAQWDGNTANALQNQYLLNAQQQQSISLFYQRTGALNLVMLVEQQVAAVAATVAEADRQRAQAMEEIAKAAYMGGDALAQELQSEQAMPGYIEKTTAAMKAQEESQRAAAKAAGDHAAAQASLAEKLAGASSAEINAELARAAIDKLGTTLKESDPSSYAEAVKGIQLSYGLATEKSYAMAEGVDIVTKAFTDGRITREEYIKSLADIPKKAKDGEISLGELGLGLTLTNEKLDHGNEKLKELGNNSLPKMGTAMRTATDHNRTMKQSIDGTEIALKSVDEIVKIYSGDLHSIPLNISTTVTTKYVTEGTPPQARAYGGPVSAGLPYLVGERGPEMFYPNQNGRIVPSVTNYNVTNNVTTDRYGMAAFMERQRMAREQMDYRM